MTFIPDPPDELDPDGYPIIPAVRSKDGTQLQFPCRYCGRDHFHGGGDAFGDGDGHRVAHCLARDSPYKQTGYILREVAALQKPVRRYKLIIDRNGNYFSGYLAAQAKASR